MGNFYSLPRWDRKSLEGRQILPDFGRCQPSFMASKVDMDVWDTRRGLYSKNRGEEEIRTKDHCFEGRFGCLGYGPGAYISEIGEGGVMMGLR